MGLKPYIKACIYTRVSTEAQESEGYSLEEQERLCKAAIMSKEWNYVKTYTDAGISGKTMERPALQEMIKDIKDGKINAVLIYKLDRLSRSQKDTLTIIEDILLPNKVDIVSLKETLDTTTPWGRAMIGILASFNQLDRETIVMRTSMGRRAKAKNGGFCGGRVPYGYQVVDKELEINDEEAVIVKEIFRMYKDGLSLRKIASELQKQGVHNRQGNPITFPTIQVIIENKDTYLGVTHYGDIDNIIGRHEPLISLKDLPEKDQRKRTRMKGEA